MLILRATRITVSWELEWKVRSRKKLKFLSAPEKDRSRRSTHYQMDEQLKYTSPDIQNEMLKASISYFLEIHEM